MVMATAVARNILWRVSGPFLPSYETFCHCVTGNVLSQIGLFKLCPFLSCNLHHLHIPKRCVDDGQTRKTHGSG